MDKSVQVSVGQKKPLTGGKPVRGSVGPESRWPERAVDQLIGLGEAVVKITKPKEILLLIPAEKTKGAAGARLKAKVVESLCSG